MGLFKKLFGAQSKKQLPDSRKQSPNPRIRVKPEFPIGDNHVDDPDIKTMADLVKWYPLPSGFEYKLSADGTPYIERQSDKKKFSFLIEEGMLGFDEPQKRPDGKVIYKTTEVIKRHNI
ncbi:MAG: hypothetical protein E4H27_07360 [Anaerolineales bacterium]|nr:MAG: hypothetical protein E4H27_07360 [Anaerolineales bacterium]